MSDMTSVSVAQPGAHHRPIVSARSVEPVLLYFTVTIIGLTFAFPFLWTVTSSFKSIAEVYTYPPTLLPEALRFENYVRIFTEVPFARWLLNSAVVTALSLCGNIISSCIVAYGFARFDFPGRNALFILLLSTLMLPVQVTIIPSYLLFNLIGWIDTIKPLVVPTWFGGGAFFIFLLRQFFMSLPMDFDEAATIDGANELTILYKILLPLAKPAVSTVAVIAFIGHWDNFLGPLIYLNSPEKMTVAVGVSYFQSVAAAADQKPMEHLLMGAALMMAMPPVILFFLAQQYFVRGIVMSGIKG